MTQSTAELNLEIALWRHVEKDVVKLDMLTMEGKIVSCLCCVAPSLMLVFV